MKHPPHPGGIIKDCISALDLALEDVAIALDMTPEALAMLLDGNLEISEALASQISRAFGSTPRMWLRMQNAYNVSIAIQ